MPQVHPSQVWHSIKQDVYHDNTACSTGNNIEKENVREGKGGKIPCSECSRLNLLGL